ncbi:MAG TPA: M23 family metallopeptidase [Polyangiales bacterium]|jgi:murein DD-endopeptidase MepM/ murein hydrolase activator NlpD|nr:M23 family metallopeptidase [Polyangiales bacterium]
MLRTPDEEDVPLQIRPLPSVDIALLPHELRAARMQKFAIGGGAVAVIAVVLGLAYGPAVIARFRRAAEEKPAADSEAGGSKLDPSEALPIDMRDPAAGSAYAQTVPAMHAATSVTTVTSPASAPPKPIVIPAEPNGPIVREERKFGVAKSWRDALVLAGASPTEANEIVASLTKVIDFRRGKPDDVFVFERDSDRTLRGFEYRGGVTEIYRATRTETGALRGIKVNVPIETRRIAKGTYVAGSVGHSLSALSLGGQLAGAVIEAFDSRVMFTRDTRAGDSVKLIVNEEYVDGAFLRYGPVQAVEYSGERCGKLQAFWFDANKGEFEFFDSTGRAVHGGWLRTPLRYDHVSSPYNLKRRHPILKRIMPHLGIDFSAGTGTPVFAAADGVVSFAGPRGPNGNLVSVRHSNGFESHYAHLWKIAPGIRSGTKVAQRQSIGFVGSTGRSTGPHLHFALKRNGKFLDPASQLNGPGDMMPTTQLARFRASTQKLRAELEHIPLAPAPSIESLPKTEEPADDEDDLDL